MLHISKRAQNVARERSSWDEDETSLLKSYHMVPMKGCIIKVEKKKKRKG